MLERVFPLIERYHGLRLDANLSALMPGRVAVVESPRRLRREQSYGFVHALWWTWLLDSRSVISVPPGAGGGGGHKAAVGDVAGKARPDVWAAERSGKPPLRACVNGPDGLLVGGSETGGTARWSGAT